MTLQLTGVLWFIWKRGFFMLYRIGEFAQFCGLSVKTLRYYDEIGLLKPVKVDEFTGYRYYSEKQLDDVELIKMFKSCSFSLDEIVPSYVITIFLILSETPLSS